MDPVYPHIQMIIDFMEENANHQQIRAILEEMGPLPGAARRAFRRLYLEEPPLAHDSLAVARTRIALDALLTNAWLKVRESIGPLRAFYTIVIPHDHSCVSVLLLAYFYSLPGPSDEAKALRLVPSTYFHFVGKPLDKVDEALGAVYRQMLDFILRTEGLDAMEQAVERALTASS